MQLLALFFFILPSNAQVAFIITITIIFIFIIIIVFK